MRDISTRELNSMGRRRFIKALAAIGVSGAALKHITKDALAEVTDNSGDRVPRISRLEHTNHEAVVEGTEPPKREPVYYTISRDKWLRVEGAENARQKVQRIIKNHLIKSGMDSVIVAFASFYS